MRVACLQHGMSVRSPPAGGFGVARSAGRGGGGQVPGERRGGGRCTRVLQGPYLGGELGGLRRVQQVGHVGGVVDHCDIPCSPNIAVFWDVCVSNRTRFSGGAQAGARPPAHTRIRHQDRPPTSARERPAPFLFLKLGKRFVCVLATTDRGSAMKPSRSRSESGNAPLHRNDRYSDGVAP